MQVTSLHFFLSVFSYCFMYARDKIFVKAHKNYFLMYFLRLQKNKSSMTCSAHITFFFFPSLQKWTSLGRKSQLWFREYQKCMKSGVSGEPVARQKVTPRSPASGQAGPELCQRAPLHIPTAHPHCPWHPPRSSVLPHTQILSFQETRPNWVDKGTAELRW